MDVQFSDFTIKTGLEAAFAGSDFTNPNIIQGLLNCPDGVVKLFQRVRLAASVMHDPIVSCLDEMPSNRTIPLEISLILEKVSPRQQMVLNTDKEDGTPMIDYRNNGSEGEQLLEFIPQTRFRTRYRKIEFDAVWKKMTKAVLAEQEVRGHFGVKVPSLASIKKYLRKFRELYCWIARCDLMSVKNHLTAREMNAKPIFYLLDGLDYTGMFIALERLCYKLLGDIPLRDLTGPSRDWFESLLSLRYASYVGGMRLDTTNIVAPAERLHVLVLGMGDIVSKSCIDRLTNFIDEDDIMVYTMTSSTDGSKFTQDVKAHVPLDWISPYALPQLATRIKDFAYRFQFDEIYLDHLVAPKMSTFSDDNLRHFFSVFLIHLNLMKMLSPTLKIIIPFDAVVLYNIHKSWNELKGLHLHVSFSKDNLGVPHDLPLPDCWNEYTVFGGGNFIQRLSSKFVEAQRIDNNLTWTQCRRWVLAYPQNIALIEDLNWITLQKLDSDGQRLESSINLPVWADIEIEVEVEVEQDQDHKK